MVYCHTVAVGYFVVFAHILAFVVVLAKAPPLVVAAAGHRLVAVVAVAVHHNLHVVLVAVAVAHIAVGLLVVADPASLRYRYFEALCGASRR